MKLFSKPTRFNNKTVSAPKKLCSKSYNNINLLKKNFSSAKISAQTKPALSLQKLNLKSNLGQGVLFNPNLRNQTVMKYNNINNYNQFAKNNFSRMNFSSVRTLNKISTTQFGLLSKKPISLQTSGVLSGNSKISASLSQALALKFKQTGLSVRTDITYKYSKKKPTRAHEEPDFTYPTNQEDDYGIVPGETLEFDNAKTRLVLDYDVLMTDAAMGPDAMMPWESAKARFVNGTGFWLPFFLLFGLLILTDPLSNQTWAPPEKPFHYLRNEYGNEPIYIEEGYPENEGFATVREKIKERRISELSQ